MTVRTKETELHKDRPDRSLLLQGLNLKLRHTFYKNPDERLNAFTDIVGHNIDNDRDFTFAATKYLKDIGMRLSPAVLLGVLNHSDSIPAKDLRKLGALIFTRPDIVANMLSYLQYKFGMKSITDVSREMQFVIRHAIEDMKDITLKKKMMRRRNIKLADLIKAFRPRPHAHGPNEARSKLYKGIIENKIRLTTDESVTALLSDSTKTKEEKVEKMKEDIGKMAINSLVRNMGQFTETLDDNTTVKLQKRFSDLDITKIQQLNPFDLIVTQENFDTGLSDVLDETLQKYCNSLLVPKLGKVAFLTDVSGSMGGGWFSGDDNVSGLAKAFKMMALIRNFYTPVDVQFFHNNLIKHPKFANEIKETSKPNKFYKICDRFMKYLSDGNLWGGTNLHGSITKMLETTEADTLFVMTDEYGNIEHDLKAFNEMAKNSGKRLVIVNVDYTGETNINPMEHNTKNVILIGGLNGKIFEYLNFFMDFDNFKVNLIEEYKKWINK